MNSEKTMNNKKTGSICVFCSSSSAVPSVYIDSARALGRIIAHEKFELIFGGAGAGLMKVCADAVIESGGRVVGVIPETLNKRGITYDSAHSMIVTPDLRSRKAKMEELADAFIAMPGGYGTMEEVMEILTLKQLRENNSPVVFLNVDGYFDPLFSFFNNMLNENFISPEIKDLYYSASTPEEAVDHIRNYIPAKVPSKYL